MKRLYAASQKLHVFSSYVMLFATFLEKLLFSEDGGCGGGGGNKNQL